MKQKRVYFWACVVLLGLVLMVGAIPFLRAVGSFLVVKDKLQPADIVIVLAHAQDRVAQAVQLYKEGYSKLLIMSGGRLLPSGNIEAVQMKQEAVQAGVPPDRIWLDLKTMHTFQDPIFLKPVLLSHGFKSAIVVTSPYHTRRAAMIFNRMAEKTGIKIMYCPAQNSRFDPQRWWLSCEGWKDVFWEYAKMAVNFWGTGVDNFVCRLLGLNG
ncbi:MAG: YdcF family protein [Candidatus Omnitrophica bacterium]|nr:YdcF family protein [Candidatus Omnitrophota bacterium]